MIKFNKEIFKKQELKVDKINSIKQYHITEVLNGVQLTKIEVEARNYTEALKLAGEGLDRTPFEY